MNTSLYAFAAYYEAGSKFGGSFMSTPLFRFFAASRSFTFFPVIPLMEPSYPAAPMPVYFAKLYLSICFSTLLEVGLIISFKNYKELA